jgi:hypothetical protein
VASSAFIVLQHLYLGVAASDCWSDVKKRTHGVMHFLQGNMTEGDRNKAAGMLVGREGL